MRKLQRNWRGVVASAGFAAFSATAQAASQFKVKAPVTRFAADTYDLHLLTMYGILVFFCIVFGMMLYAIYAHRGSGGDAAARFHQTILAEIVWAVIPFIIVFGAAWPATRTLVGLKDAADADITIKATGMQWKWGYEYVKGDGSGISFFSNLYAPRARAAVSVAGKSDGNLLQVDNPVVVPVNKKIRLILTANDVIHSWHVPDLGVKQDAIPGLARDTWFDAREIGTYRGLCSIEACGAGRACVLIVVKVVSDGDYKTWVEGRRRTLAAGVGGDDPGKVLTVGALRQLDGKSSATN